jgi:hypothetical protein
VVNKRRIISLLSIKGIICIVFVIAVGIALVVFTASVTVNPARQISTGAITASWDIYVNEVNQARYLPGGFSEPTLNTGDPSTYASKVVTDSNRVCAVKIELTSAVDSSKFSNFNITVRSSSGGAWSAETLYASASGATTKSYIDGLTPGDSGYIHQTTSTTKYYEMKVTYSYDKVDETDQLTVVFQYTPLPQDSFG